MRKGLVCEGNRGIVRMAKPFLLACDYLYLTILSACPIIGVYSKNG